MFSLSDQEFSVVRHLYTSLTTSLFVMVSNRRSIAMCGYSRKNGGAARALDRWIRLLEKSSSIEITPLIYEESLEGKTDATLRHLATSLNYAEIMVGQSLNLTDGGNLSLNLLPSLFGKKLYLNYDFVNLHWFHGEMLSMNQIRKIPSRVIWTLHDMWLFCGIGHYQQDPNSGYKSLLQRFIDSIQVRRKAGLVRSDDIIICPTNWLANIASDSLKGIKNIQVIPNPIPFEVFKPHKAPNPGTKVNKANDRFNILVGSASNPSDKRKGFDLTSMVIESMKNKGKVNLISFGYGFQAPEGVHHMNLGYLNDDKELQEVYNSADLTLITSRQDNLPQVMTESLACGTPVAGFDVGGIGETLNPQLGLLAEKFDIASLSKKIDDYIDRPHLDRCKVSDIARTLWGTNEILNKFELLIK